jgi:hypothetical protein
MDLKTRQDLEAAVAAKFGTRDGAAIVAGLSQLMRAIAEGYSERAAREVEHLQRRASSLEQALTSTRGELAELRDEFERRTGATAYLTLHEPKEEKPVAAPMIATITPTPATGLTDGES